MKQHCGLLQLAELYSFATGIAIDKFKIVASSVVSDIYHVYADPKDLPDGLWSVGTIFLNKNEFTDTFTLTALEKAVKLKKELPGQSTSEAPPCETPIAQQEQEEKAAYIILVGGTSHDLAKSVGNAMTDGYKPQGGVGYHVGNYKLMQAMVLRKD